MHNVQDSFRSNCKRIVAAVVLIFICTIAFAKRKVTGTVKDYGGEPLIGVSVVEVGTSNGTVTDINGNYTLNVKPGACLKISYVGFNPKEVRAGDKTMVVL